MSRRRSRAWRTAVAATTAALALTACSLVEEDKSAGPEPAPASPTVANPKASAPRTGPGTTAGSPAERAPAPPRVGQCYALDFDEATAPTSGKPAVSCKKRHTTQTYYVGRLDTVVDGHLLAVDSRLAQRQISESCPRHLDSYVGGSASARELSRIKPVWFSPTIEQSDKGASWFRCDAVALDRAGTLASLPSRLHHILDRSGGLDEVGLCGTAAPGAQGFERVICSRRHAWKALSTISISGDAYPGVEAVRSAGESDCRDQVSRASGSPERFSYGWEWPTQEQWQAGQHFGYCWAPE